MCVRLPFGGLAGQLSGSNAHYCRMRETSLNDFADGATDGSSDDTASATYVWTPSDAACDGCGVSVTRRWRAADGLVCVDCKDW